MFQKGKWAEDLAQSTQHAKYSKEKWVQDRDQNRKIRRVGFKRDISE